MERTIVGIIVEMMKACGAYNIDRWSWIIQAVFDEERRNPGSVFSENDADRHDPFNRVRVAFGWQCLDEPKRMACMVRMAIAVQAHRVKEHGGSVQELSYLKRLDETMSYPDVDAILSLEQAETGSFWDFY
jgi:hypothetical protein